MQQAALASFEDEMVVHCRAFAPHLDGVVSEEKLREAIRQAIGRARGHGFTCRGPVRLFIELTLLFGCAFDTDPLYAWAAGSLENHESRDEMRRASELYQRTLEYVDHVAGPEGMFTHRAFDPLRGLILFSPPDSTGDIIPMMCGAIAQAYPEKAGHVPSGSLELLFRRARDEAAAYGMGATDEQALFCILHFALGHGCTSDPLYPWIAAALNSEEITGDERRVARLRREAVTWIEHVIAAVHPGE